MSTWGRRRLSRGLTLIEILVVIVIIALLVVAMVLYLRPRDDRLVQIEAERLAKYLTGATAEAMMRDGPVRVSLDFETQVYDREIGKLGAAMTGDLWEDDPHEDRDKVKKPVRLAEVLRPGLGEMTAGTSWLLWDGRKTEGGVVVLVLNEAVWSVVVEPVSGRIHAERGRVQLPDPTGAFVRRDLLPPAPDEPLLGDPDDLNIDLRPGSLGDPPDPRDPPDPNRDALPGTDGLPSIDAGLSDATPPDAAPGSDQFVPDLDAALPIDAEPPPPDGGSECHPETRPCGESRLCVPVEGTPQSPVYKCIYDPRNKAFRANLYQVMKPEAINGIIQALLNGLTAENQFNLVIWFPDDAPPQIVNQGFRGWTMQARYTGMGQQFPIFEQHPKLPSYSSEVVPRACPENSGQIFCAEVIPNASAMAADEEHRKINLFLPRELGTARECYTRITLVAQLLVTVYEGNPTQVTFALTGMIKAIDARAMKLDFGPYNNLEAALLGAGAAMDGDFNHDGDPDGWQFSFVARAHQVERAGDPSNRDSVEPDKICQN